MAQKAAFTPIFAENTEKNMAILKIHSQINTADNVADLRYFGYDGISYKDVDEFVTSIAEDDNEIELRLHCEGGVCTEGWAIYDRLRASGKEITAIVEGLAASMATVILMAAPKERRKAYENATLLVHNPYTIAAGGTADELRKAAEDMQMEQDRILDLYVERCGCDRDEMQALMNENKPIDAKKALEMGLIGEIIAPASARGNVELKYESQGMETTEVKTSLFQKMLRALGFASAEEVDETALDAVEDTAEGTEALCMELSAADGSTISIERESGSPQVGDKASPDGEWTMPDGRVIVIEDGVITEIRTEEDTEAEDSEEVDEVQALRDEVENLKAQLADALRMAKTADDLRILNAVKMAGGEDVLRKVASEYVPDPRTKEGKDAMARADERAESPMRMEIEARKKGEWKK